MSEIDFTAIAVRACVKCGATERYKRGDCKACAKALSKAAHAKNPARSNLQSAAWYLNNKKQAAANCKAWAASNPEKTKAYAQTDAAKARRNSAPCRAKIDLWQKANQARVRATSAAWVKANVEVVRIYGQNARAKEMGVVGVLSRGLISQLFRLQQGTCPCCKEPLGTDFHSDHIIALSRGGLNVDYNVQLLRAVCNAKKHAKDPLDFMQSQGFLL